MSLRQTLKATVDVEESLDSVMMAQTAVADILDKAIAAQRTAADKLKRSMVARVDTAKDALREVKMLKKEVELLSASLQEARRVNAALCQNVAQKAREVDTLSSKIRFLQPLIEKATTVFYNNATQEVKDWWKKEQEDTKANARKETLKAIRNDLAELEAQGCCTDAEGGAVVKRRYVTPQVPSFKESF